MLPSVLSPRRNVGNDRSRLAWVLVLALLLTPLMLPAAGHAMSFKIGDEIDVDMDVHLSWSGAWRYDDRDDFLVGQTNPAKANADDGNNNFDKGAWINNLWSITADIEARYKNSGLFLRPRAYYDLAYAGNTDNEFPLTNNNNAIYGGSLSDTNDFTDETLDVHRDKVEILDAYLFTSFDIGDLPVDLRVGRQVANWGESVFSITGIGPAMNPLDGTKLNTPGVELRDVFLPTGQVLVQMGLPANFSVDAYWKFEYDYNRLDEAGSYFSIDDYIVDAGERFLVPGGTVPRDDFEEAKDDGQWGIALHYVAEALNDTEFGFYYINYHDHMPSLNAYFTSPTTAEYDIFFKEDIELFGFSAGTNFWDTYWGLELSYRKDVSVLVQDLTSPLGLNYYTEADCLAGSLTAIRLMGPSPIWSQLTLVGEFGFNRVYEDDQTLNQEDDFAWGGTVQTAFEWLRPIPSVHMNLKVPVTYAFARAGSSSMAGSYIEREDKFNITVEADFFDRLKVGIGFTDFLNDGETNRKADRDNISAYVKYSF